MSKLKKVRSSKDLRQQHNQELIERMRIGDPLKSYDNMSSWFPPRPVIKKNQKALDKLYQSEPAKDQKSQRQSLEWKDKSSTNSESAMASRPAEAELSLRLVESSSESLDT